MRNDKQIVEDHIVALEQSKNHPEQLNFNGTSLHLLGNIIYYDTSKNVLSKQDRFTANLMHKQFTLWLDSYMLQAPDESKLLYSKDQVISFFRHIQSTFFTKETLNESTTVA